MIADGFKVHLKGCLYGEPGTWARIERERAVVLWTDIDHLARHPIASLQEANHRPKEAPRP